VPPEQAHGRGTADFRCDSAGARRILVLSPGFPTIQEAVMPSQFRNLIFEGGGVKGIAYVGAMQVLQQRGVLAGVKRVGGASAGAINALIFGLGYGIEEQQQIMRSAEFRKFMDGSFGVIRDIRRLARDFGWYKGDFFSGWIGDLVRQKLGTSKATFGDLKASGRPDVYMIGTNLSTGYSEVFSYERHADMAVAQAVRISMSIPLFFAAVRQGPRDDVYVDGGVMLNYPVKLFDRARYIDRAESPEAARETSYYNKENARFGLTHPGRSPYVYNRQTLGLRLDTQKEIALYRYDEPVVGKPIRRFDDYAGALVRSLMNVQENVHLHSDDWQRTVYVNTLDVRTTDFGITRGRQDALVEQGILGTENYFTWFEDPDETPVNRVETATEAPPPASVPASVPVPGHPLGVPVAE
jgi:NTE family protein